MKMKRECCVPMCSKVYSHTYKKTQDSTTYFSFPTNEVCQRVWAKLVSRREKDGELWMPASNSRICSLHFEESQFRYWASYRRLLPNALPTIFPGYPEKILRRQAKIIENFRKNNPLGVETLEKSIPWRKRKGNESANEDDNVSQGQDDANDTYQSESEISKHERQEEVENHEDDKTERRLSTEDSEEPKRPSEESKPFKKRRIDTELQSNGDVVLEYESRTEPPKSTTNQKPKPSFSENYSLGPRSKKQPVKSPNEPIVKIQRLEQKDIDSMLGRGKRAKKRSVKLEYDSEESKMANDSPMDEDYVAPGEFSKKLPEKGNSSKAKDPQWSQRLEDDKYDSGESRNERKMRVLQQQIKWKDERLYTLNQKAVSERNARLKAEKELEFLKNYMKSKSLEIPEPNESDLKINNNDRKNEPKVNRSENLPNKASPRELEMVNSIKRLKEEIALKDKSLAELKKNKNTVSVRNDFGALQGDWHPKNKYIQTVKRILEDSMEGEDQALFLLDQLESYGKDDVEQFRMTTIKKCVEWKLLNARGYESVRHMGILALPSTKILRDHVDVLTETGVTAKEDVGFESDLGELEDEMTEEELQMNSMNELPSSTNKVQLKKAAFLNSDLSAEDDEMLKLIGKTRQKFMKELPSSSSKEDDKIKIWVGNKQKNPTTTKIEKEEKGAEDDALEENSESGESKQPFRMKLPSGILIEEVQPAVESHSDESGNASLEKDAEDHGPKKRDHGTKKLKDESIDAKNIVSSNNEEKSGQNKEMALKINEEVLIDEDPTSENLTQDADCADIDDELEPASEEMMPEGNSASEEVVMEGDSVKPASVKSEEGLKRTSKDAGEKPATENKVESSSEAVVEPVSEDIVEAVYEDMVETITEEMVEHDSDGHVAQEDSSELKDEINEEELPPGCYIEEVQSSDDDSS
uniref:THAP-type domain-containing protein n=1 Tax=Lygus hesperus TaxID=30085 RepID=A0A146LG49_LYGHE